jgi:hypothetical protein
MTDKKLSDFERLIKKTSIPPRPVTQDRPPSPRPPPKSRG